MSPSVRVAAKRATRTIWGCLTTIVVLGQIDATTEYGKGALIPGQVYVQFCWDGPTWHAYSEKFALAR